MAGLSACTAPTPTPTFAPTAVPLPDGVTVGVKQYRLDYAPRALEISVTNGSGASITVTRAAFDSPLFDGTAAWTRATEVPAGSTRDLRVLLGDPVCDAPPGGPVVTISFETSDGAAGRAETIPADRFDTVAKVTAQDCLAERTFEIAALETGAGLRTEMRDGELVALLDLTATSTGGAGSATVLSVGRTTLVTPSDPDADSWPLDWRLPAASGALTTTIDLVPSNCNPHIVAEDKRGTYLPLAVALDDGTTGTVFVGMADAVREQVYDYIARYCRW